MGKIKLEICLVGCLFLDVDHLLEAEHSESAGHSRHSI
jgi:hypothetical protein